MPHEVTYERFPLRVIDDDSRSANPANRVVSVVNCQNRPNLPQGANHYSLSRIGKAEKRREENALAGARQCDTAPLRAK
jgi:hypothetical protein